MSGYWLAGRATRPLATILQTTARLHPDNLSERLPLRGSGDELDRLSATINSMLDRLAAHLEQQRLFVANAAHELRSPLAAMRTSVEVALQRDRPAAEYRDLLADLVEQCAALSSLINSLLLLAEGDAGLLHADGEVRLDQLATAAVDMFQGIAEQRGLELGARTSEPVRVRGNSVHWREVIHNLIDNALKFTPAGGQRHGGGRRVAGHGAGDGCASPIRGLASRRKTCRTSSSDSTEPTSPVSASNPTAAPAWD